MVIYKLTNTVTGKCYIGQTIHTAQKRFSCHCCCNEPGSYISKSIRKYGKEAFTVDVIATASSREQLNVLEVQLIKEYNTMVPAGYNIKEGGAAGKLSEESLAKMRTKLTGRKLSTEHVEKIRTIMTQRWESESHRKAMREKLTGQKRSEEMKQRMREAKRSKMKPITGKHISTGEIVQFESISSAKTAGFNIQAIANCLRGDVRTHKKFIWNYNN